MTHDYKAAYAEIVQWRNLTENVDEAEEALRIMTEVQEGRAKIVPAEPASQQIAVAVNVAMHAKLSSEYGWHEYMADLYKAMLAAAPYVIGKEGAE